MTTTGIDRIGRFSCAARELSAVSRELWSESHERRTLARVVELGASLLHCELVDLLRLGRLGSVVIASTNAARSNETLQSDGGGIDNPALLRFSLAPTSDSSLPPADQYALRFLAPDSSGWDDADVQLAMAFADLAALSIDRCALRSRVQNLALGLESNRLIGMAIGILMAHHRVTDEQAFDLLRVCSQESNRKLRQVAEDVVLTGQLPGRSRGAA